jgi:hypothetical protein
MAIIFNDSDASDDTFTEWANSAGRECWNNALQEASQKGVDLEAQVLENEYDEFVLKRKPSNLLKNRLNGLKIQGV